jgi:hypothetical protein
VSEGRELGADLYRIWLVGSRHLPEVGDALAQTAGSVLRTDLSDGAFRRPGELGGGLGSAHQAIADVRGQLLQMLGETSLSMHLTGDALVMAANTYAATDDEARAEFEEIRDRSGGGVY